MITFTKEEFLRWVFSQPDENPVDMKSSSVEDKGCGCLMVQFLKSKEFDKVDSTFFCGCQAIFSRANNNDEIAQILDIYEIIVQLLTPIRPSSFGEAKKMIQEITLDK